MRTQLTVITLAACLAAGPAFAASKASKEETIGVGVGATVGALAGGPIGFVIGAAIGAKIGDEFHEKDEKVDSLSGSLQASATRVAALQTEVQALNADIDALGGDLQRMRAMARPELLSLLESGIRMDLLFRTEEHELADSTSERLAALAASLAAMPDIRIAVDGYADERGIEAYNRDLSVRRAEYVRDLLTANGVPAERIQVSAHGESPTVEDTADNYALQRKVSLTLYVDDNPSFAANPN
ncbi:MAG TPA: OmpA family protein [Woeseiaceae bacterium]|nr:OmpA family protein [Woeseiaceae bacterium]